MNHFLISTHHDRSGWLHLLAAGQNLFVKLFLGPSAGHQWRTVTQIYCGQSTLDVNLLRVSVVN